MKPILEGTWTVESKGRPSIRALLNQFIVQLGTQNSGLVLARGTAVMVDAQYTARGTGWIAGKTKRKRAHHLNAPSATAVAALVGETLVSVGFCEAGQIVGCQAIKLVSDTRNALTIKVQTIAQNAELDTPVRRHKILQWYLTECRRENKRPTRVGFHKLLRSMSEDTPENAAAIDAALLAKAT